MMQIKGYGKMRLFKSKISQLFFTWNITIMSICFALIDIWTNDSISPKSFFTFANWPIEQRHKTFPIFTTFIGTIKKFQILTSWNQRSEGWKTEISNQNSIKIGPIFIVFSDFKISDLCLKSQLRSHMCNFLLYFYSLNWLHNRFDQTHIRSNQHNLGNFFWGYLTKIKYKFL